MAENKCSLLQVSWVYTGEAGNGQIRGRIIDHEESLGYFGLEQAKHANAIMGAALQFEKDNEEIAAGYTGMRRLAVKVACDCPSRLLKYLPHQ